MLSVYTSSWSHMASTDTGHSYRNASSVENGFHYEHGWPLSPAFMQDIGCPDLS